MHGMDERRVRMRMAGMSCTDCERHVQAALARVGARGVQADHRRGEARFTVAGPLAASELVAAVEAAGYRVLAVEPETDAAPDANRTRPRGSATRDPGRGTYDLAIVGSGGAAFAAAIRASERGARVVMIERGTLGGTCVNVGCVPSKTLLRAGEIHHLAGHHPFAGLRTQAGAVDLAALVRQKDELVADLRRQKYEELIAAYGWELVAGEAAFADAHTLRVGERSIRARAILIATGARPAVPDIPGLEETGYLTSTTALSLERVPDSVAVIGSGYVALELGQLLRRFGARVTLMQRSPHVLKAYDPEVGAAMTQVLRDEGIELLTGVRFVAVEGGAGGRRVRVEVEGRPRVVDAEHILVATGRQPNTEALHLERAGVRVGPRGEVLVDGELRTNVPHILAAGDVTAGPQFVYVAAYEGGVAAENALGGHRQVDLAVVPAVTFTHPAIARVGLGEVGARQAGYEVKSSVLPLASVPRALVNRDTRGLFKLVADAATDRVLGVQVVAEDAGEAIYAATLAVRCRLTVAELTATLAPYLTMAEGIRLAAQAFGRDVRKLSCCAG
jgi:mercuric reductase